MELMPSAVRTTPPVNNIPTHHAHIQGPTTRKERSLIHPSAQRLLDSTDHDDVRCSWERREAFIRLQSLVLAESDVGALMEEAGGGA
jgi:hypothetical protein